MIVVQEDDNKSKSCDYCGINNNLISTRDKKNYNEVNSLIAQQFNNILSAKLISIINYIFYYRSDNQQSC